MIIDILKDIAFFLINGFRYLVFRICLLFPIDSNKVFVNYFDGKGYGDHPKYIIKKVLEKHPNTKVYWVYSGNKRVKNINYIRPFSIISIYHQATSKIWISSVRMPYYSIKRKNQFYFQTWHGGLAFKRIEHECENALSRRYKRTCRHDSKMIDYWVSSNSDNTKLYKEHFWFSGGTILEVGAPRNDIFFNNQSEICNRIKTEFNLNGFKVAMYAPTFRKENSFSAYNLDLGRICSLLEDKFGGKWKLVVRLHPRLAKQSDRFIQYNDSIIDGSKIEDIQEMLAVTDLLITDYSSIALDYMNTLRPVLIYASDIEEYKKDRDFHLRLEDTPFPIAINQEEFEKNVSAFDINTYQAGLKEFMHKYNFYDDGNASLKVADIIIKLMKDE